MKNQSRRTTRDELLAALDAQRDILARVAALEQAQLAVLTELRDAQRADEVTRAAAHAAVTGQLAGLHSELKETRLNAQAVRMAAAAATLDEVNRFYAPRQLSLTATLERVRDGNLSLARFGDGEIRMMLRAEYRLKFQRNTAELQHALSSVLAEPADDMLLALPTLYHDRHWAGVWSDVWHDFHDVAGELSTFGNAHVSRPIFFQLHGREGVDLWRSIWQDRAIVVVTGEKSRFELIPPLFDNVSAARFVRTTPTDAFDELPRTLARIHESPVDLVLIALGPAGTVLAHQLARSGTRALDVGHLSDSYLNVFHDAAWPEEKPLTAPGQ